MNQAQPCNHLEALAAIASAAARTEVGAVSSSEALLLLRQYLGLRDAHVCRTDLHGGRRRLLGPVGAPRPCALPEPPWDRAGCAIEADDGWVTGFAIADTPGQVMLHLLFDREPGPNDLATGVVAAALIAAPLASRSPGHANGDPVTGLPGREVLERHLLDRFAAGDPDRSVSLILADVNGLKAVNDRLGHPAGDRLLHRVASVIADVAASLGTDAVAARIGGDEFAIAATGLSDRELSGALDDIDSGARALGGESGIARGAARVPGHAPGSRSPAAAMHGLIRLADAQLYANKPSPAAGTRQLPSPSAYTWQRAEPPPARALSGSAGGRELGATVEERLSAAAGSVAEAADAAAWWISRREGESVADVQCGRTRPKPLRWDEPEQPVVLESNAYPLDDFPTTREALAGGHFHATLLEGDLAERACLAYTGYRSVIAAGGSDQDGRGWLIEIYGDYLTDDLAAWEKSLAIALQDALVDADTPTESILGSA